MSKKKKSIMDGYFDEPITIVEINPFVENISKDDSQNTIKPLDSRETGVRKIENSALDISTLVGKEKMLVNFIALECKKLGELETNFLSTEELKSLVSLDSLGLRNLIFRVKEKNFSCKRKKFFHSYSKTIGSSWAQKIQNFAANLSASYYVGVR